MQCHRCRNREARHVLVTSFHGVMSPLQVFCDLCATDDDRMACWLCAASPANLIEIEDPATRTVMRMRPIYRLGDLCVRDMRLCIDCEEAYEGGVTEGLRRATDAEGLPILAVEKKPVAFKVGYLKGYVQMAARLTPFHLNLIFGHCGAHRASPSHQSVTQPVHSGR